MGCPPWMGRGAWTITVLLPWFNNPRFGLVDKSDHSCEATKGVDTSELLYTGSLCVLHQAKYFEKDTRNCGKPKKKWASYAQADVSVDLLAGES